MDFARIGRRETGDRTQKHINLLAGLSRVLLHEAEVICPHCQSERRAKNGMTKGLPVAGAFRFILGSLMKNPGRKTLKNAVALAYSETEAAPRVVAKGRGVLAEQIITRARDAGVYVHESPELVSLLMQIDLDQRIPPQLYLAIAELLAWLYRLENGQAAGNPPVFDEGETS